MKIKCPRCGSETRFTGNLHRPFCSERCKMVDLGRWMSEAYQVPVDGEDNRDEQAPREETRES